MNLARGHMHAIVSIGRRLARLSSEPPLVRYLGRARQEWNNVPDFEFRPCNGET